MPGTFIAELPHGRVLGPHRAVIASSGALVQDLTYYFGTTRVREHPVFLRPFPQPPLEVGGRLGVLATRGDLNYYHFLMDVLPRLAVAGACPDVATPALWYVPAAARFQRELLDKVGIDSSRRVDSSKHPHVRAELLVLPSPPAMTVVNPPWVVKHLRATLLDGSLTRIPGRGIYITRGGARHNRTVRNENELTARLQDRGFSVVDPDLLSVDEQIRMFAEATTIVAPHGAALANLVFASPGSTMVELFPAGNAVPDFWKLSSGVPGLTYRYQLGLGRPTKGRSRMIVSDITVDIAALETLLHALGA